MTKLKERMSSRVLAILVAITLLVSVIPIGIFNAFAAGTGTASFTITVEDDSNNPLESAIVTLTKTDDLTETETGNTDSSGAVVISNLYVVDYTYEISLVGYETKTGAVTIVDGGSETITLDLEILAPEIANITAPAAIKAGETLSLTAPTVTDNSYTTSNPRWQIKKSTASSFTDFTLTTSLDTSYNNAQIIYAADYYDGTNNQTITSNEVVVTVNKATPTLSLSVSPTTPRTYPQSITITATFANECISSGNVIFETNGTQIGIGTITGKTATYSYIPNAGNYSYTAEYAGDTDNESATASAITYDINKANITSVTVSQTGTLTYNGTEQTATVNANATSQNSQTVTFTYSKDDITFGAMPTYKDAGIYTVYYKATAPNHNDYTGTFDVTIGKATLTKDNFTFTAPSNLIYTGTAKSTTVVSKANGPMIAPTGTISIDYYNGVSKLSGNPIEVGTYTVKINVETDTNYLSKSDLTDGTWTFTVSKATLTSSNFTFTPPTNLQYTGIAKTATVASKINGSLVAPTGTITIDYYNGLTKLSGAPVAIGTYTVKINVTTDSRYLAMNDLTDAAWTFTITNNYIPEKNTDFTTTTNGWINTNFVISAKTDDYEISTDNKADGTWTPTLTYSNETASGVVDFYVRNKNTNAISVKVIENYKIDKTPPTVTSFEIKDTNDNALTKTLNFLSFGIFFNAQTKIIISTNDVTPSSVVKSITLIGDGIDIETKDADLNGKAEFLLPIGFNKTISAKAMDIATNTSSVYTPVSTDGSTYKSNAVLIENTKSIITITSETKNTTNNRYDAVDSKIWYATDTNFTVDVSDADSGIRNTTISINGKELVNESYNSLATKTTTKQYTVNTGANGVVRKADGSYEITVIVVDNAGNTDTKTATIYKDIDNPTIAEFKLETKNGTAIEKVIRVLSFGFFFQEQITVAVKANDTTPTSGLKSITYHTVDIDKGETDSAKMATALTKTVDNNGQITFDIPANFKGHIYAKGTDNVENIGEYYAPDSLIIESEEKHNETGISSAKITNPTAPYSINGIDTYNSNVTLELAVQDTYSGIQKIEWYVKPYNEANSQEETVNIGLTDTAVNGWTTVNKESNIFTSLKRNITITDDSNLIKVFLKVTDNTGHTKETSYTFNLDKTKPKIDVVYNNNDFSNDKYLGNNLNRKAVITVTELNFKQEDVKIKITKDEQPINIVPNFKDIAKDRNNDKYKWEMEIDYSKYGDGDYTFEISYNDLAENSNDLVKYNGRDNVLPTNNEFTIDNVKPIIEVTYDNNDAQNTNYYKAVRIATIKVTEHNWKSSNFKLNLKAAINSTGAFVDFDAPNLSGWTTNGDVHTATITYSADGRYTFSIGYTDLADNKAADFTEQVFFVDRTMPVVPKNITELGITNYVNGANSTVAPKITVTDNNYNANEVTVTLKGAKNGTVTLNGAWNQAADNRSGTFTFSNFANEKAKDDIYTLTVIVKDKAGNEISSGPIEFSVNRYGSTFDLKGLDSISGGYFKTIQDIVIREINPNKITSDTNSLSVSRNGNIKELVSGTDYTVAKTENKGFWSEYNYTVKATNYKDDGKYITTLKNKDEANNTNSSDDDAKSGNLVSFAIDNTIPTAAISGIEKGKMYSAENVKVTVALSDNIKLKSVEFVLNGNKITGTSLESTDTAQKFELTVPSDFNRQSLVVNYVDEAGNENSTSIDNFLVNSSTLVQYYQNKPLFYGSVGGLILIILGLAVFFIFRKRKSSI